MARASSAGSDPAGPAAPAGPAGPAEVDTPWWERAVFYQIYPRSFADSNRDGIGDLPGIRARLPDLAWLGIDAVWLSPFYQSPMVDFGYDVSDYCAVDQIFGTMDDFDGLLADAHALGLKVIIDWVPNHSSDRHPWFVDRALEPLERAPELVLLARPAAGRQAPQQLGVGVRPHRAHLDPRRRVGPVVPPSVRAGPAGSQLGRARRGRGDARRAAFLARPRSGRLPSRRDSLHRKGPRACRRPGGEGRHPPLCVHRRTGDPRAPAVDPHTRRFLRRSGHRRRDLPVLDRRRRDLLRGR